MKSIRTRLLVSLLLAALITATVIGMITFRHTLNENEALFDYQLRQIALSLRDQGMVPTPNFSDSPDEVPDLIIQIWTASGTVMYMSRPGGPLLDRAILGYADVVADNQRWRVYSLAAHGRIIQVAQPLDLRRDLVAAATLRSLLPLLAFVPLMAFLIWWLVNTSMASLKRLVSDVGKQDVRTLNPLSVADVPTEITPLIRALNSLLDRMKIAFANQRAFVADAAHELRSPLTALDLQLQLLARAPDEAAKADALEKLHDGVERATRLIEQLLTAARTDPNDTMARLQPVELAELARHVIADIFVFAGERDITIELIAPQSVTIEGDANMLRILIRNLLDNAIRYSPRGGSVRASVLADDDRASFIVEDNGPGVPEEDYERVFNRFYRKQADDLSGSGLGLAIVKNIIEQHGAQIQLGKSDLGGLKVSAIFRLG
jgi:two-component system OmpR family sensor kinase/two-component system sensor histidine kinase QseC